MAAAKVVSYGVKKKTVLKNALEGHIENLSIQGFTVLPGILPAAQIKTFKTLLDQTYHRQKLEAGEPQLHKIKELDLARALLVYDPAFLRLAAHPKLLALIERLLGAHFVLQLQNGIINRSHKKHHQSAWHRDLPYQDYVVSQPIAVSALFCLDHFNEKSGGTVVLPFSHRLEALPSDEYTQSHQMTVNAPAGSVLVFNSMLYHRGGANTSGKTRRGINHVYTVPIIKQQISFPHLLKGRYHDDPLLARLLGYESHVAESLTQWRHQRELRADQGRRASVNPAKR